MKSKKRIKKLERRVERLEALVHSLEMRTRLSEIKMVRTPNQPFEVTYWPESTATPEPSQPYTVS